MTGNGGSNAERWRSFYWRVSGAAGCDLTKGKDRLPFAPDWLESVAARIATGDLVEATAAWVLYRGNGNHSEAAVHIYGRKGDRPTETFLRQRDCALEIAWLRAGNRREWLDAPLDMFRAEAARLGIESIEKSLISDAITRNRIRGVIADETGYRLALVPAPKVGRSAKHLKRKSRSPEHQRFLEWAKVARSSELSELEDARSKVERLRKVLLSDYKEWRKSDAPATNGERSYKPLEPYRKESCAPPPPDDSVSVEPRSAKAEVEEEPASLVATPVVVESSLYATFKAMYPAQRFDEPDAKPFFDGMSRARQAHVIERLKVYKSCKRWQTSLNGDHGRFIPMASNWLPKCDADPPPYIPKKRDIEQDQQRAEIQEGAEMLKAYRKVVFS